jgi:putative SOS response-associated peptidase YedK
MCGRFAIDNEINELIELFVAGGGDVEDWRPSWNIRPTDPVPVVFESNKMGSSGASGEAGRRIELGRWSLTPSWSKELKTKFPTFNARSEDVATKASFKASVVNKRALIPATGYYEWHTEGKTKTPYFIHGSDELAFAALYSWWKDASKPEDDPDRWTLTATILTMAAVPSLASIHDRNPVPLPRAFWDDWLSLDIDGDQHLVDAAVAAAVPVAESLEFHEVAPLRGENGPGLTAPV